MGFTAPSTVEGEPVRKTHDVGELKGGLQRVVLFETTGKFHD